MQKLVIGTILLLSGIAAAAFGFVHINSNKHQLSSMVSKLTGTSSDPSGEIAIAAGLAIAIIGAVLMIAGSSKHRPE